MNVYIAWYTCRRNGQALHDYPDMQNHAKRQCSMKFMGLEVGFDTQPHDTAIHFHRGRQIQPSDMQLSYIPQTLISKFIEHFTGAENRCMRAREMERKEKAFMLINLFEPIISTKTFLLNSEKVAS